MTNALPSVLPAEFQELQHRFALWRRTRRSGMPIPPALWAAAIRVAHRHGATRTARALGLDSHKLKMLMEVPGRTPPTTAPVSPDRPAFVELVPPPAAGRACRLEVEGPRGGRLRLELTGHDLPDMVALSRALWGRNA